MPLAPAGLRPTYGLPQGSPRSTSLFRMEQGSPKLSPSPPVPFPPGIRAEVSPKLTANCSPDPACSPAEAPTQQEPRHLRPLSSFTRKYFCFMTNSAPHFSRVILMN